MDMNYCRRCGKSLLPKSDQTFSCSNDHLLYINSAPTASIFVVDQAGSLLLSRRGIEPGKGMLDSFGGFVDNMETVEDAAIRELSEETGLMPGQYEPLQYLASGAGSYLFQGENRSVLTMCFWTTIKPGVELIPSDDVAEIVKVSFDTMRADELWNDDIKTAGYTKLKSIFEGSTL